MAVGTGVGEPVAVIFPAELTADGGVFVSHESSAPRNYTVFQAVSTRPTVVVIRTPILLTPVINPHNVSSRGVAISNRLILARTYIGIAGEVGGVGERLPGKQLL